MNITKATITPITDDILELSYTTLDGNVLRHRIRYDRKGGGFVAVDLPQPSHTDNNSTSALTPTAEDQPKHLR